MHFNDYANRLMGVNQSGGAASYIYNGLVDRIQENATHFVLDLNAGLTQVLADGSNTYLYGNARIAQLAANDSAYFLSDALGSVRQLADSSGTVSLAKNYEPYGESLSSAGQATSVYGYTGEWTDNDLVYLRARFFQPSMGRFMTRDPWQGDYSNPMSYNAWLYGYGNPISFIDPNGMKAIKPWTVYQAELYRNISYLVSTGYTPQDWDLGVTSARMENHRITSRMMLLIEKNFEGNPNDVNQYCNPGLHIILNNGKYYMRQHARAIDQYTGQLVDYNKYDFLFSGWADYWSLRAGLEDKDYGLSIDPNLLKAISMRETGVGTTKYDSRNGSLLRGIFPLSNNEIRWVAGECTACTDTGTYKRDYEKFANLKDPTWGLFSNGIKNQYVGADYIDPSEDIAMYTRLLYMYIHEKWYLDAAPRGTFDLMMKAIGGIAENTGKQTYLNQIWDLYTMGAMCSGPNGDPDFYWGSKLTPVSDRPLRTPINGFCNVEGKLVSYPLTPGFNMPDEH